MNTIAMNCEAEDSATTLAETTEWQETVDRLEDLASLGSRAALCVDPDDLDLEGLIADVDALRALLAKLAAKKAALAAP